MEYFLTIDLILIFRLFIYLGHNSESRGKIIIKSLLYLLPVILFNLTWGSLMYVLLIILIVIVTEVIGSRKSLKDQALWVEFATILLGLSFLFNVNDYSQFNTWIISIFTCIGSSSILINSAETLDWNNTFITLFGF